MEERVARLEKAFDRVDAKLDRIGTDLAEVKGKLSMLPDAKSFGALEGRVNALPTTWQITLALISTWAAGSAIVFALTRLTK
ncbi:hypothetical protein SAMN04488115_104169 [Bosea lathyri]|uniref:Haemolysin XhlA n=2 Tax=Bosea lathyri TaxID=1036778 RepID=A0A1H5YZH7_9HYPH|nr:hypothetical protein SAMN04488115_104169 [Bosea lathyri]